MTDVINMTQIIQSIQLSSIDADSKYSKYIQLLMRKKNINFAEQIKNSENFLQKLQNIKKTSKDIKDKNKLTVHRNIWVKEFKYLSRLERDFQNQFEDLLQNLDHVFQYQYEQKQVFKNQQFKSFKQMKEFLNHGQQAFINKLYKQVQNLPLLIQKCDALKKQQIQLDDIQDFINDVDMLLQNSGDQLNSKEEGIYKHWGGHVALDDELDQVYEDITYYLRPLADQVQGFDLKKDRLKKIEEGESHLMEYLDNFKDKLSRDQIYEVIEEFNQANNLLFETLELQIEKISLDYEDSLNFSHQVIQNNNSYHRFLHLYQIYIGRGKNLIQYFQRLSLEFPKVSKTNIQKINNYVVGKIFKERKIKASKRNFFRQKQELLYKVQKEVNLRIENKNKEAQKEAEKLMRREEKLKLQTELQALRADYNKRQEEKQKQLIELERNQKNQEKKRQSIRRLYLQDLGKRAEQVKQAKQEKEKIKNKELIAQKEKEEQEKKKKIMQNQPKVHQRQSIQRTKIHKKVQARQYKAKEKYINEERINKAIEQYPFRPQPEFSEQRLIAPTQAQILRKQTVYDKADKIELTKMTGYTVNQLMGDMRFRLNTALQEAGLAQTDYARQLLTQMSKKPS